MIPDSFHKGWDTLCIDACSMIYHLKMGLLSTLAAEVRLISTEAVVLEVGWPHLPVEIHSVPDEQTMTHDDALLALAVQQSMPVLSEDKEILKGAEEAGLEYYNSLMSLNYLLLKKRILHEEYPEYLNRLIDCAHYSRAVLDYGNKVYEEILVLNRKN